MREPLTDGANSFWHVALGFAFGAAGLIPFAAYQYVLAPDPNSTVDTLEYLLGYGLRAIWK